MKYWYIAGTAFFVYMIIYATAFIVGAGFSGGYNPQPGVTVYVDRGCNEPLQAD